MTKIITILISLLLMGCTTFRHQFGFLDVNNEFTNRTGEYLYWRDGSDQDKIIDQEIDRLLSEELTPDSATQIALLNNHEMQATYNNLGIAQADLIQAGLIPNPILEGEFKFPGGGPNIELSVVQNFIEIFQIPLKKKVAQSKFEETKLDVINKALSLSYQVRNTFYLYQAELQLLDMTKNALVALDASRELAMRLHRAGNINDLELAQEKANFESIKVELLEIEEKTIKYRDHLNLLMGLSKDKTIWKISDRLPDYYHKMDADKDIQSNAVNNNIQLSRSKQELITLLTSLDLIEKYRLFNENEIGATAEKESGGKWNLGPKFSITIPLFDSGEAEIYKANAEVAKQIELNRSQINKIETKVLSLIKRLQLTEKILNQYMKEIMPLKTKILDESQKHYNAMLIGAFQLLNAKHEQINTGKRYIGALRDYWLLYTEIESVINGYIPNQE